MNKTRIQLLLILVGLLLLLFNKPIIACVLLLLGIVMIIEKKWPEKWESEKSDTAEK